MKGVGQSEDFGVSDIRPISREVSMANPKGWYRRYSPVNIGSQVEPYGNRHDVPVHLPPCLLDEFRVELLEGNLRFLRGLRLGLDGRRVERVVSLGGHGVLDSHLALGVGWAAVGRGEKGDVQLASPRAEAAI